MTGKLKHLVELNGTWTERKLASAKILLHQKTTTKNRNNTSTKVRSVPGNKKPGLC